MDTPGKMQRLAVAAFAAADLDRAVSAILNTEDVALDGYIVRTAGIDIDAYMRNPVVPFAHKSDEPPVARMVEITRQGTKLLGRMQFADAETYPFADTIHRLIRGGFLNATSIGWQPIEWERMNDRKNPNGLIFTKSQLLEVSIVPVPANPEALVTARSAGIDTRLLFDWAERALDAGGLSVIPRAELEALRMEARMPRTSRTAPPAAPEAPPVAVEPERMISDERMAAMTAEREREEMLRILEAKPLTAAEALRIAKHWREMKQDGGIAIMEVGTAARAIAPRIQRGLGTVSYLACILEDLAFVQEWTEYEAAAEGDNSPVPAKLMDAVKLLGATLVDMTAEEVAELLAEDDGGETDVAEAVDRARSLRALAQFDTPLLAGLVRAAGDAAAAKYVLIEPAPGNKRMLQRVGKAISAENRERIGAAHEHCRGAMDALAYFLDETDDPNAEDEPDAERALRERKARAARAAVLTAAD